MGKLSQNVDSPKLFEKSRFLDEQPGDTNIPLWHGQYSEIYERARSKLATVKYIGDNIPGLYRKYREINREFSKPRFLHIVRDPVAVARLWNGRAKKGGLWPPENDYRKCVLEWNKALLLTLTAIEEDQFDIGVINYAQLFERDNEVGPRLMRWLGLDEEAQFSKTLGELRGDAHAVAERKKVADDDIVQDYVREMMDTAALARIQKHFI